MWVVPLIQNCNSLTLTYCCWIYHMWGEQWEWVMLKYVCQRPIFGAGTGKEDYCDVLSSGVNLSIVEGSQLLFHPLVS